MSDGARARSGRRDGPPGPRRPGGRGGPATASRSRPTWGGAGRPRSASTRARWSRSPRPSRRASASGWWSATGRASPTPARSTPTWSERPSRRPGTTPASPHPTSGSDWPRPTAWSRPTSICGATTWPPTRPTPRWPGPWSWSGPCEPGDPRIRAVESAEWGDAALESAVATSTGIRASSRRTACYLSAYAIAGEGSETQTGGGYSVGRSPDDLDLDKAARDAVRRSTRLLGAVKPRSAHVTVVFEPEITATLLSVIGGTLDGEAVLKGRSLFADRIGESVSVDGFTLVDDPTDPEAYGAGSLRRRRPGHAAQRPDRRGRAAHASCTTPTRPAGPGRPRRPRRCGPGSRADRGPAPGPSWSSLAG